MRTVMVIAAAAALSACGGGKDAGGNAQAAAGAPVKQQPGSWTNKIEVTKLEVGGGVDTAKMKEGMQTMLDAASAQSLCITPEYAAKFDSRQNMERMAAQGKNCTFDRKVASGEKLDFSGICTDQAGNKMRVSINGTSSATAQDMVVKAEPADAAAPMKVNMEMHIASRRTGECKPGDITPPLPGAAPGAAG